MRNNINRRKFTYTVGSGMVMSLAGCIETEDGDSSRELEYNTISTLSDEDTDYINELDNATSKETDEGDIELGINQESESLQIYMKAVAPQSNYEFSINKIELINDEIMVEGSVDSTDDAAGLTAITSVGRIVNISDEEVENVSRVNLELIDGWSETHELVVNNISSTY